MSHGRIIARKLFQINLAAGEVCADWLNVTPNSWLAPKTMPNLATRAVHVAEAPIDRVRKSRLIP